MMKICQVDTNAISEIVEDPQLLKSFEKFIVKYNSVIGLSTYSFYELLKREHIYKSFLKIFPPKRIAILKPGEILFDDEIKSYPNKAKVEPIFIPPSENFNLITQVFESEKMKNMYSVMNNTKDIVLNRIVDLKKTYPPKKNGKYSKEEITDFVKIVTRQQLERFRNEWYISRKNESINYISFKSLTAQLYITFYKFYILKDRKPKTSDVIDIAMTASFPYVDFVLTEKNLVNDIKRIQKDKMHFDNIKAYTLTDIKNEAFA